MRVYISGQVSGLATKEVVQLFCAKEDELKVAGYEVINPVRLSWAALGSKASWEAYMAFDLDLLLTCEAIAMIDGWKKSQGARLEYELAKRRGLKVINESS